MASELKHENKFTWSAINIQNKKRLYLNIALIFLILLCIICIILDFLPHVFMSDFGSEHDYSRFSEESFLSLAIKIVGACVGISTVIATSLIFIDKCCRYAITAEGIYQLRWLKTRFANEDILFPWDKIKVIMVRKNVSRLSPGGWTAVVLIRGTGIMKILNLTWFPIGFDDERLQEFLGAIQPYASEKLSLDGQVLRDQNK